MISEKMQNAINDQINAELYSAYLYLSMASYFHTANLPGFANWMEVQAGEESFHAKKFFRYLIDRGGRALLKSIAGPPTDWKSPQDVFEEVYKHEQKVTSLINSLVDLAIAERDHASNSMLQWFVTEQVEEESNAIAILEKIKMAGATGPGLFMIDAELSTRMLTVPLFGSMSGADAGA